MTDIALTVTADNPFLFDIDIDGTDLATGKALETGILMSIFTNRRAATDDVLMLNQDPEGWWGDTYAAIPGDLIGSRLWELQRSVQNSETALIAKNYVAESLAWLIADGIVDTLDIQTSFIQAGVLGIVVNITQPSGNQTYRYSYVWSQI